MRIETETLTLKDGRTLTLRTPDENDAQAFIDYMVKAAEDTHFLIRYPEEISPTLEKEKEIIMENAEADDAAWFSVFDGDKVVGNCSICRYRSHLKVKHRCVFAIAIDKEYWGCGLGEILMKKSIAKAKEMGFDQLELGVYEDNERARALYRKMGFEECGILPRAYKLKDGTYVGEVSMVRFL
ncbi:GNAT family N-acetyltransferase [Butyrivibrio sp. VCD2006]|uniref:GNAT family N-acetyltransferase n=1 Tax=Butyrivibrio sp. VCD2006 TaxID=1280664 RepID=UPI00040AEE58|nr:GNAT family N-acetyltransferase [Butyrivibrio sp. VCD2006]